MTEQVLLAVLPGLMCDSRCFPAIEQAFPDSIIIDDFYDGCSRLEDMAKHALTRLPDRFALLGHSMGARVALEILRLAQERVSRVALVDTGIHEVRPGEADKRHALGDLGRTGGMEALCNAWLPPMLSPSNLTDRNLVAALEGMVIEAGIACYDRQIEALLNRREVTSVLSRIRCPLFAIVGEEDAWSPVSQHRDIVSYVDGAQLRVIAGAGHMMPAERPDAFHACLREWMRWPEPD